MDKNVLKKFAIESRQELMEKVANKINRYFVDEEFNVSQNGEVYVLVNDKHTLRLTKNEYENRQLLVKRIKEITLEQVIEEAAYTWFNRIIAIRYMEIHDYLPLTKDNQSLGVRVLSSKDNTPDPEIMKISNLINPDLDIEFNKEYYGTIQDNNKRFEYILLLVCKKLGKVIPQVFDGITDYIDILVPDNLLNESGYVTKILKDVSEENFVQVEIIGWLYQYYNQTEKDKAMAQNRAYKKNEIPYVTQLFTPDWIVKYMVENSLGRFWIEHSGNMDLIRNWKYYIIESSFEKKEIIDPKRIKCIDPCMGSGHILVYIFEVLFQIYESYGYSKVDIPRSILENNIYGLDIDDRAGQLSILSVLLKAREYDKNIFNYNCIKDLNIISIQESSDHLSLQYAELSEESKQKIIHLEKSFEKAKEIGSLLKIKNEDYSKVIKEIEATNSIFGIEIKNKIFPLIKQATMLSQKYDIVITNPPYMGSNGMSNIIKNYLENKYYNSRSDLCTAFMELDLVNKNGYYAMINMQSWMFLVSYIELRNNILENKTITSMLHLGMKAFEGNDVGTIVQTTAFVIKNAFKTRKGIYIDLTKYNDTFEKEKIIIEKKYKFFEKSNDEFLKIPGYQLAYWASEKVIKSFKLKNLNDFGYSFQGIITGKVNYFLKLWTEVEFSKIIFGSYNANNLLLNKVYFPYIKGGTYRKWYGNHEYLIFWEDNGKGLTRSRTENRNYFFKRGITWSLIASKMSFRIINNGFLCDVSGSSYYANDEKKLDTILAFLNSKVCNVFLSIINPTFNSNIGDILNLPIKTEMFENSEIEKYINQNINISREDWDSFETSWNFTEHPLLKNRAIEISDKIYINQRLENVFNAWNKETLNRFEIMKRNEEELNEIFINMYGFQDELTSAIEDNDITIRKADREREIKSLISYFIGCVFGRYSLDEEGLIYAGGEFNKDRYKSFNVDVDNIIPLTEDNYFGDDIVSRFKKFIEVVYGKETLYENLEFIAKTLGKKNGENSEETIRRYFINDFYNDHIKIYQKRPIYWLFDSGKKNGFKCLIYMHRYNEGLVSKIRLDYLHRMQNTYEKELKEITDRLNNDIDLTSKRELSKRQADISAKLQETNEYDEKIAHIADQKIKIDLDDGVVVNYAKFSVKNPKTGKDESILAKIK